jgi:release factor glutamine methyltransferase
VWATDRSSDALAVARANLAGLGRAATRVRLVDGDWFAALPAGLRADVIVSNPPYVGEGEPLPPEVADWEPVSALRAGERGLDDLFAIVDEAPAWLVDDGVLVVELAPSQAAVVADRARAAGFADVEVRQDLVGRDRMVVARLVTSDPRPRRTSRP